MKWKKKKKLRKIEAEVDKMPNNTTETSFTIQVRP